MTNIQILIAILVVIIALLQIEVLLIRKELKKQIHSECYKVMDAFAQFMAAAMPKDFRKKMVDNLLNHDEKSK